MTVSGMKRSMEADDMQVDSSDAFTSETGTSVIAAINECFGTPERFMHSSQEAKAQTLALLGSIDFSLEDLEQHVLNSAVIPQIFVAMNGTDRVLAEEAAVCIKNLMTNELLGSKCTRRLYGLSILPLISNILAGILNEDSLTPIGSNNFVEAIAVQLWCIATSIPAALTEINASPLAALVTKRLPTSTSETISAENAFLQAFLVAVEDNEPLAQAALQLNPQFLSALSFTSATFDAFHLNSLLRLMCFLQISRCVASAGSALDLPVLCDFLQGTLLTALPESSRFEGEPAAVKLHFEILEMAAESLELLIAANSQCGKVLKTRGGLNQICQIPFVLANYYIENFQKNFAEESNADRLRLVRRIFSLIGTLLTIQEQLIISGNLKISSSDFVARMEQVLKLAVLSPSDDYGVSDEVSGWLRAWLSSWGEEDYPAIGDEFFAMLVSTFCSSSSPVVLTNSCALASLLIPYAPESIQKDFCVFLNNLLCTDPFDVDHLEVLLAAVDGVTGIFDPQSQEWPAKSLTDLKSDLQLARDRLRASITVFDVSMKNAVSERIKLIERLHRIL